MKKFLSIALAFVLVIPMAIMFAGCTSGTYKVESIPGCTRAQYEEKYGNKFDYENANAVEKGIAVTVATSFATTLTLKSDGTVEVGYKFPKWFPKENKQDSYTLENITWKEEDGVVSFYSGENKAGNIEMKDGKIIFGDLVLAK